MKKCPKCGSEVQQNQKMCPDCGQWVANVEEAKAKKPKTFDLEFIMTSLGIIVAGLFAWGADIVIYMTVALILENTSFSSYANVVHFLLWITLFNAILYVIMRRKGRRVMLDEDEDPAAFTDLHIRKALLTWLLPTVIFAIAADFTRFHYFNSLLAGDAISAAYLFSGDLKDIPVTCSVKVFFIHLLMIAIGCVLRYVVMNSAILAGVRDMQKKKK